MKATTFELNVSLPHDARLVEMVRELAVQAAQCAGCGEAEARAFGRTVEAMTRESLETTGSGSMLPVVLRRGGDSVECLVDGRRAAIDV
jgi:hypothetical protein